MALQVNDQAPNFILENTDHKEIALSDFVGSPLVLFFYPKDFTAVCTKEACSFRDEFEVFDGLGITVFGINKDLVETHQEFKKQYNLPYELLSDPSGRTCKAYKALIPVLGMVKRITYLLDHTHKIVAVYENMFKGDAHTRHMFEQAQKLKSK